MHKIAVRVKTGLWSLPVIDPRPTMRSACERGQLLDDRSFLISNAYYDKQSLLSPFPRYVLVA